MNEPLTPSLELLKEINENPSAFDISYNGQPWRRLLSASPEHVLGWAIGQGIFNIRRKQWVPEVGKLIAVRETHDKPWAFGVFDSISRDGLYVVDGYHWNYARPVLPEELSK